MPVTTSKEARAAGQLSTSAAKLTRLTGCHPIEGREISLRHLTTAKAGGQLSTSAVKSVRGTPCHPNDEDNPLNVDNNLLIISSFMLEIS